tara:strand:- start:2084 stop:2326 length:243 start_codon:yes stop_codon:yes gene_type:complete
MRLKVQETALMLGLTVLIVVLLEYSRKVKSKMMVYFINDNELKPSKYTFLGLRFELVIWAKKVSVIELTDTLGYSHHCYD